MTETEATTDAAAPPPTDSERRALNRMVAFHLATGVVVMAGGFAAGSQALKAGALDLLGIGSIAAIALAGIPKTHTWRARAALIQAVAQGLFCFIIIVAAVYRIVSEHVPQPAVMAAFAAGAFTVNAVFAYLVLKDHGSDAGAIGIWRQGRGPLIEYAAILAAALVVWLSGAPWADSIVAVAIAAPLLRSAWTILRDARGTLSGANRRRRAIH